MKLHLPFGLRKAVMACLATYALPFSLTVTSGTVCTIVGGAALITMAGGLHAEAAVTVKSQSEWNAFLSGDENREGGMLTLDVAEGTQFYIPNNNTSPNTWVVKADLVINNAYWKDGLSHIGESAQCTVVFEGSVSGDGVFSAVANSGGGSVIANQHFVFCGDMSAYSGDLILEDHGPRDKTIWNNSFQFAFTDAESTSGTGSITVNGEGHWMGVIASHMTNRSISASNLIVNASQQRAASIFDVADMAVSHLLSIEEGAAAYIASGRVAVSGQTTLAIGASLVVQSGAEVALTGGLSSEVGARPVVEAGGTLTLGGRIEMQDTLLNEGTLVFAADAVLALTRYSSFELTDTHIAYIFDVLEGSGACVGLDSVKLEGVSASAYWKDGSVYDEVELKDVTLAELAWADGAAINDHDFFGDGDAVRFVTHTEATLEQSVNTAAVVVTEGAELTLKASGNHKLTAESAIWLEGDLVLTKGGLLADGTHVQALSEGGRVVVDFGANVSFSLPQIFGNGSAYSDTFVVRSGRVEENTSWTAPDFSLVIVEDGGQYCVRDGRTQTAAMQLAGDGWGNAESTAADRPGALRLGINAHQAGDVTLMADAAIMVYNGTAYVDATIDAAGHTLGKRGGGTLVVTGTITGTRKLDVVGTLQLEQAWTGDLSKSGSGTLTLNGMLSGDGTLHVESATVNIAGGMTGSGTVVKTGAGELNLSADTSHTGTMEVREGSLKWGANEGSAQMLRFSEIIVEEGATMFIAHKGADISSTKLTLRGGTLHVEDMDKNELVWGDWVIEGDSVLSSLWNSQLVLNELTGHGNLTISKANADAGEIMTLKVTALHNYSGGIVWDESCAGKGNAALTVNEVHQDAGYAAYVDLAVKSSGFRKTGEGAVAFKGGLTVSHELWMRYEGELSIEDNLTVETGTMLHYGEGDKLIKSNGGEGEWLSSRQLQGTVFIYAYDFTEDELRNGVNLGLSSSDASLPATPVLGLREGDYEIRAGEGGALYLYAESGSTVDPTGTDGRWDSMWDSELARRPLGNMPVAPAYNELPEARDVAGFGEMHVLALSADEKYDALAGYAHWVQITADSTPAASDNSDVLVFGGVMNDSGTGRSTLSADSWIWVSGGNFQAIAGGNGCTEWNASTTFNSLTFNGNSHIVLRADKGESIEVFDVVGGNYRNGSEPVFEGDSYVSVFAANIKGSIVGGSSTWYDNNNLFTGNTTFRGNSHVYIHAILEDEPQSGGTHEYTLNHSVIGGNYARLGGNSTHQLETFFTGTSEVMIDLSEVKGSARRKQFEKMVVGGDCRTAEGGHLTHTGDTWVTIAGAEGVTFTRSIFGGSYDDGNSETIIKGSTHVLIESGVFADMVVAGSNIGTSAAEAAGTGNPNTNSVRSEVEGDTFLSVIGGEFLGYDAASQGGTAEQHAIGSVALVGGNFINEMANTTNNLHTISTVGGTTHVQIAGGSFAGHIIGATAMETLETHPLAFYHTAISVGGANVTMLGGEMVKSEGAAGSATPRLVGGMLIHNTEPSRTGGGNDNYFITLGDVNVTVGGDASVYDVVGGSWTPEFNATNALHSNGWNGLRVTQGSISVALTDEATVQGDVFAAGIQGGAAGMETADTAVSIGAGVTFAKSDGSPTIVSGGYLATAMGADGSELQDAYGSYYEQDELSYVKGTRSLTLTDAVDYADRLSVVRLLNFDEVEVQNGASATVAALLITEAGAAHGHDTIALQGGGTLALKGSFIEVPDRAAEEAATKQVLNNSAIRVTEGSSLRFLNSGAVGELACTYIDSVSVEKGSLTLDLAAEHARSNDHVLISRGIEVAAGQLLAINLRVSDELTLGSDAALITGAANAAAPLDGDATLLPTLSIVGAQVNITFTSIDLPQDAGKHLSFVLADNVLLDKKSTTFNTSCNGSIYKWFGDSAHLLVQDDAAHPGHSLVRFDGTIVSAATADYHRRNASTRNGYAGATLLDALYSTVNPEQTAPGSDRAKLLSGLEATLSAARYAEADRTMAAAAGASLPTLGLALADDVERQLRSIRNRSTTAGGHYDSEQDEPSLGFWINAENDYRRLDAENTLPGYKLNSWGGTVGMSSDLSAHSTVGLALTAMYGDIESDGPDRLKGDLNTAYVSGFARTSHGAWSHTFIATVGLATAEVTRTVTHSAGSYTAKSDTNGYAVGLAYEVGYSYLLNEYGTACLQPVLNVSWRHTQLEGFTESGTDAALQVGDQDYDTLVAGMGLRLQSLVGAQLLNRSSIFEARVMAKCYMGSDEGSAQVGFVGMQQRTEVKTKATGKFGLEFGAGLSVPTNEANTSALFADASVELRSAYTNFNVSLGWKASF